MSNLSIMPIRAYYDIRIEQEDIVMLGIMCSYTDERGMCYPSLETISNIFSPIAGREKSYDPSSISKKINRLEEYGYVVRQKQRLTNNGGFKSMEYKVIYDTILPLEFDRRKNQASTEKELVEIQASHENPLGNIQTNDPYERPILNDTPQEKHRRRILSAASEFSSAKDDKTSVASPQEEKKHYLSVAAKNFAILLDHEEPSKSDYAAAKRCFDCGIQLDKIREWAGSHGDKYKATKGKEPNAYWIYNDLDNWKARGYKVDMPQEFSGMRLG